MPVTNALAYCLNMSVRKRKGCNETQSGVTYIATIYKYLDHNSMPVTNALAYCLDMSVRERKGYNETQSEVTYIDTFS
jgi:hypothetical protein